MTADEHRDFMDRPDMQLIVKLHTVSATVNRSIQLFCHYETLVRQDMFLRRLPFNSGARRSLGSLRKAITAETAIALTALWDEPKGPNDFLDKESFPALLAFAATSEVKNALQENGGFCGRLFNPEADWVLAFRLKTKIEGSVRFKALKNLRDYAYAHRLRQTNKERQGMKFIEPIHGDLNLLFALSLWCRRYMYGVTVAQYKKQNIKELLEYERSNTREMWKGFNRHIDTFREPFRF